MGVIEWIGFILTVFGVGGAYSFVVFLLGFLPANLIPHVWIRLNELEASLDNPEAVDAIPSTSQLRIDFAMCESCFGSHRVVDSLCPRTASIIDSFGCAPRAIAHRRSANKFRLLCPA